MPKTATSSAVPPTEAAEHGDAARAVARAQPQQQRGEDGGADGRDDDLVDCGAAGGRCCGEKERAHAVDDTVRCPIVLRNMSHSSLRAVTDGDAHDEPLTIDELARRTGMTARNIRAHQSRGLLPPPALRGRTGFYGPEHVERVQLIQTLQGEGFNLEGIRRLLQSAGDSSREVLRFTQAARSPFANEQPEVVALVELADVFGEQEGPALLQRAVDLGLLRPLDDGRFEQASPRLVRAGRELAGLGVPATEVLATLERLHEHADGVARAYVALFEEHVWAPFDAAGRPVERWPEVRATLERLRPLAAESLLALFGLVMAARVDEAIRTQLEQVQDA
jgi:DNA-binding transcriptional MerR regulator